MQKALLFDFGGTNLRWGLWQHGTLTRWGSFEHAACASPEAAFQRALLEAGPAIGSPEAVLIAVAGPVFERSAELTNRPGWILDRDELAVKFGWKRIELVNDLAALALGLGRAAEAAEVWQGGGELAGSSAPHLILAVGTGLGAALRWGPSREQIWSGEAGHSDLPVAVESERPLAQALTQKVSRLSREKVLSGPGLVLLYRTLAELKQQSIESVSPQEVALRAASGTDPIALHCCRLWSRWLGATAGDLVLIAGAWAGCYLTGGVLAGLGQAFDREAFLTGFREKDRMGPILVKVPVRHLQQKELGLWGLSQLLETSLLAYGRR